MFDLGNHAGPQVYVRSEVAAIDGVGAVPGSADLNRRSWSHNSELTVPDERHDTREPTDPAGRGDGARTYARDPRLELMRPHPDRARCVAPGGRTAPRPPGRLRRHRPVRTHVWAATVHRPRQDPDGRTWWNRLHRRW